MVSDINPLLVVLLVMVTVTGLFYAFAYPYLSGDKNVDKRVNEVAERRRGVRTADRTTDAGARRKQISDSLKEIEERQRSKAMTLDDRIAQAGLDITKNKYFAFSAVAAIVVGLVMGFGTGYPWLGPAGLLIGGLGLPHWVLNFLRARRMNKFVQELPNAIDIIVRGVRAGLPLGDCLRIIASEAADPVRGEFRTIVEQQTMGLSLAESVERMARRMPVTEANFLAIVVAIQAKSGGNLSEALGNLSKVLRERKKMRGKISAMSMEAKASAAIIGALPFVVATLIYITAPSYMGLLFTTQMGRFIIAGSLGVMFIGVMVMRNMIRFDI